MVEIQLDDEQQHVVTSDSRALVVVAGAAVAKRRSFLGALNGFSLRVQMMLFACLPCPTP